MIVTNEAVLRTVKTYLPYVCLCVLSVVVLKMFEINQSLYKEIISGKTEQAEFWHDAFDRTTDALQNVCPQGHEHPAKDTLGNRPGAHSR